MDLQKTGALIAQARKDKGLTQQQLAKALHISHTTVSKWERGLGFPEVSLLEPLAAELGLTLTDLFRGEKGAEADVEETVNQAVRAAREELLEKQRDTRSFVITMLVCAVIIISLLLWGLIQAQNKPYDIDLCGFSTNLLEEPVDGVPWDGGYYVVLSVFEQGRHPEYTQEQWFELYLDCRLVEGGTWEKRAPNFYQMDGELLDFDVIVHRDGSFYFQLPGVEKVIVMQKYENYTVTFGQDVYDDHQKYRALLTAE